EKFKEAGKSAEPPAKSAWQHTKEGATNFGHSVKNFFTRLFSADGSDDRRPPRAGPGAGPAARRGRSPGQPGGRSVQDGPRPRPEGHRGDGGASPGGPPRRAPPRRRAGIRLARDSVAHT